MKTHIKIYVNGKEEILPCRVTLGALLHFKEDTGKDISEIAKEDVLNLLKFVWYCVASACNADGISFDISFDRFADCLSPEGLAEFYGGIGTEKKTSATAVTP